MDRHQASVVICLALCSLALATAAETTSMAAVSQAPFAPPRQYFYKMPNGTDHEDPYHWLRDDDFKDKDVVAYISSENDYAKGILKENADLEDRLIRDMDRRVPRVETTFAAPSTSLSYWYGSSRGPGQDYWVYTRRPAAPGSSKLQAGRDVTPLSFGPDQNATEETVLDVNRVARGFDYCDVPDVKPSTDGRLVAYTVDTVGDEKYALVVQEVGTGKRVPIAGGVAPSKSVPLGGLPGVAAHVEWTADSSALLALLLTPKTNEAFKLVRVAVLPPGTSQAQAAKAKPEVLLQDNKAGAILEIEGPTTCGRFMVVSRSYQGYSIFLGLPMRAPGVPPPPPPAKPATQPKKGIPAGVKLYGNDTWTLIAPESDKYDVLRADHLYGDAKSNTFAVLMDSDQYPDGFVGAITNGDLKKVTVLVPGKKGRQIVDILVAGGCPGATTTTSTSNTNTTSGGGGGNGTTASATRPYLVVHILEDMVSSVQSYDISGLRAALTKARRAERRQRRQHRRMLAREGAAAAKEEETDGGAVEGTERSDIAKAAEGVERKAMNSDSDSDHDTGRDTDRSASGSDVEGDLESITVMSDQDVSGDDSGSGGMRRLAESANLLPPPWNWAPGPEISSLHLDHSCWPGTVPYVRLTYSCMTTPVTTVDLDLAAKAPYKRGVEKVTDFDPARYRSELLWATSHDGTRVPVSVAGRADAWPTATGTPLPAILQLYGAYGRKLLPDFIPADLTIMDGAPAPSNSSSNSSSTEPGSRSGTGTGSESGSGEGPGPVLLVLAHVRGGGELGARWHTDGKRLAKNNTALDLCAVAAMLVERGYARPGALAVWGRSAGGLAAGMVLHRCPPGTFRAALLDVPFLDVLGSMMDPSLPLTIKERPEWGDPLNSQEDYNNILSYSPYDNAGLIARQPPALLATTSVNDPRVPYWGPAKYVARLRAAMAADAAASGQAPAGGPVMLLTDTGAGGHFSASGASGRLAERAMRAAFMLAEMRKATAGLGPAKKAIGG